MTARIKRICVFAGASAGNGPEFAAAAKSLGEELCRRGYDLVFGGGRVGLMGATANAVLANGGKAYGVIPEALAEREIAFQGLTELHVVRSMHERKALMAELSDAFVALPGGLGTLEELFEVLTWGQLGFHRKPAAILNVDGYYDGIHHFIAHAVASEFLKPEHQAMIVQDTEAAALLDAVEAYAPPTIDKLAGLKEVDL